RCRRKRQDPNSSDKRGMAPNKDQRDSHGSIRQAHLQDAQSGGGAGPTTEWDKRHWPAPCLNQPKRGLSKQPQARRREGIYSWCSVLRLQVRRCRLPSYPPPSRWKGSSWWYPTSRTAAAIRPFSPENVVLDQIRPYDRSRPKTPRSSSPTTRSASDRGSG